LSYLNRQFNFNIDSNSIYEQNLKFSYRSTSESFAFEILSQIISRFSQNELQEYIDDIQQVLSKVNTNILINLLNMYFLLFC